MRTTPLLSSLLVAASMLSSTGCGGDGDADAQGAVDFGSFPAETTCGLAIATTGDLAAERGLDSGAGCLVQLSSGKGVDASFFYADGELDSAELQLPTLEKGELGEPWAPLAVHRSDGVVWEGEECFAKLEHNEKVGEDAQLGTETYRIAGRVTCRVPLTSEDTPDTLYLRGLSFVVTVSWQ